MPQLKVGDVVKILEDGDKAQALQKRHGGWQNDMSEVMDARVGRIQSKSITYVAVITNNLQAKCCLKLGV